MDNLENPASGQSDAGDLRSQFEALHQLVVSVLILVIVVSGTFNIYLLRQWRTTRTDLDQAKAMMNDFNQMNVAIQQFVGQLGVYGSTHPDFVPILNRYGIRPTGPGTVPAVAPAGPSVPAPKK